MPIVESSLAIATDQSTAFDVAQDYDKRLRWDPFLRAMRFLHAATAAAVGVQVWVRAHNGLTMTVEYITLNRPKVVAMKMLRGPVLFRKFSGSWRFVAAGAATEVTFRYQFECRPQWLQAWLHPLVQRILLRDMRARLRGLQDYIERGIIQPRFLQNSPTQ